MTSLTDPSSLDVQIEDSKLKAALLRAPLQLYRQIIETAEEGVWLADNRWMTVWVNERLAEMFGYTQEQMIGRPITDFMDDAGRRAVIELQRRREAGVRENHEFRFVRCDGSDLWTFLATNPLTDENGVFIGALAMLTDISARKQVEMTLNVERVNLSAVLENSPDQIWAVDRDYRLIVGNSKFLERLTTALGYRPGPGDAVFNDQVPADVQALWKGYYERAFAGEQFSVEVVTRYSPEPRFMDYSFTPIYDASGQVFGVAVDGRDVTDYRRAVQSLRRSEHLYRTLAETMKDLVWVIDPYSLCFAYVSPSAYQLLGYEPAELLGKSIESLLLPAGAPLVRTKIHKRMARFLAEGKPTSDYFVDEVRLIHRDGRAIWTEVSSSFFYDEESGAVRLRGTTHDIDRRHRAEEALRNARDELELRVAERTEELRRSNAELARALRVKDSFLAAMSHELHTPLNPIISMTEVLLDQVHGVLTPAQQHEVDLIRQNGLRLLALINSVLDLTRINAGDYNIEMAPVDANSICQLSIQTVREDVSRKSLDLVFIPADPPVLLEADAPSLKRILVNLLSNAVKFTPEGGKITLQVLTDAAHATVFFVVEDTGIGIAPEHVEQIFAPFVQLGGGLTRLYEGAGLGLTLVEQLVKLHGGTVTVHSEGAPGQGSRFVVSLPRQAEARQKATFPEV
ncbi:MAG: hypothetical protein BroJett021_12140 [Chloroflexota bacterium]|nr:PAS domain S-box protein [Caldilinea sp.]GIK72226.1 MAG: hypothetical protein BroJett021_12140 [Chloroflexota bacterium]